MTVAEIIRRRRRESEIGNLSNYDMDIEEDEEEVEEDEPDYESMAESAREDMEWEAEHYDWGNWNYPDDRW